MQDHGGQDHGSHDYGAQRRETFATFRAVRGDSLPKLAMVDYRFFLEETDADWAALEKALRAAGFRTRRAADGITLVARSGTIPITPEEVWDRERTATAIALKHDFYPDGWELAGD